MGSNARKQYLDAILGSNIQKILGSNIGKQYVKQYWKAGFAGIWELSEPVRCGKPRFAGGGGADAGSGFEK